jgi:hypothetical protein
MMAAKAMPVGDEGAMRNGPASTNHQTVTPGCTKLEMGSLTMDGMALGDDSSARETALAVENTNPAQSHRKFLNLLMAAAHRKKATDLASAKALNGAEKAGSGERTEGDTGGDRAGRRAGRCVSS